jgi:hypothetical protein
MPTSYQGKDPAIYAAQRLSFGMRVREGCGQPGIDRIALGGVGQPPEKEAFPIVMNWKRE